MAESDVVHQLEVAGPTRFPALTAHEINAIKALHQHNEVAFNVIVRKLCGVDVLSYCPGDTYGTAMNEGRRFVGMALIQVLKTPTSQKVKDGRGTEQG